MHSLPLCSSIPHRALRPHATHGSYLLCLQTDLNLAKGKATINISGDQVKYQIRYTSKKKKIEKTNHRYIFTFGKLADVLVQK